MAVKIAMVTGASRGIGLAIAQALLADHWLVIGVSRTPPPYEHGFYWQPCDVTTRLPEAPHRLDALIHCAAVQGPVAPLDAVDMPTWLACVETNLIAAYKVVRTCLPALSGGRVLLFSGGGAFYARPNYSAYAVAKAGVVSLMETLAIEQAGRVSINCIAPGFVPTGLHQATLEAGEQMAGAELWSRLWCAADTMPRVVECVRHLLSDACDGLTGKTVSVEYDPWWRLGTELAVDAVNASPAMTRTRVKLDEVAV